MKFFNTRLDTVLENGQLLNNAVNQPTIPNSKPAAQQPVDTSATVTYTPQQNQQANANRQLVDAANMQQQIRDNHMANMPVDQKIALALQQSSTAERLAYRTLQSVEALDKKLDRVFNDLSNQSKTRQPGESILDDEDDPESIFGR